LLDRWMQTRDGIGTQVASLIPTDADFARHAKIVVVSDVAEATTMQDASPPPDVFAWALRRDPVTEDATAVQREILGRWSQLLPLLADVFRRVMEAQETDASGLAFADVDFLWVRRLSAGAATPSVVAHRRAAHALVAHNPHVFRAKFAGTFYRSMTTMGLAPQISGGWRGFVAIRGVEQTDSLIRPWYAPVMIEGDRRAGS
jgi:hypothetical protein